MAVIRQDMFGDGQVMMDYYPHKRVEIRVCDFKISVCKPFGIEYCSHYYSSPVIQMSSNSTVSMTLNDFRLIEKSIARAVEILNGENDGIIITNNFEIQAHPFKEPIPEYIRELHNVSRQTTKTKSIPYKDIKPNYVYEDVKGHQWVYLGEGYLFEESTIYRDGISRRNRQGCYLVYLDFDRIKNYNIILENGTLEVNGELHSLILDTYCSKKRFIKQVKKLGEGNILKVQGKHGKYLFRPI